MKCINPSKGRVLWKFNCSLLKNANFVEKMKNHISVSLKNFDTENITNEQLRWELLKYEMRKFSKSFSKQISFEKNKERQDLEKKVKTFECEYQNFVNNEDYRIP